MPLTCSRTERKQSRVMSRVFQLTMMIESLGSLIELGMVHVGATLCGRPRLQCSLFEASSCFVVWGDPLWSPLHDLRYTIAAAGAGCAKAERWSMNKRCQISNVNNINIHCERLARPAKWSSSIG